MSSHGFEDRWVGRLSFAKVTWTTAWVHESTNSDRCVTRRGVPLDGWYAPHPLRRRTPMVLFAFPCTYLLVWCFDRPRTSPFGWCWISRGWTTTNHRMVDARPSNGPFLDGISLPIDPVGPVGRIGSSLVSRSRSTWAWIAFVARVDHEASRNANERHEDHHRRITCVCSGKERKKPKREKRTSNAFRVTSSWNEIRHVGKETWKKETRKTRHVHERTESNVWNVPPVRFVARKETRGRNDDATIGK